MTEGKASLRETQGHVTWEQGVTAVWGNRFNRSATRTHSVTAAAELSAAAAEHMAAEMEDIKIPVREEVLDHFLKLWHHIGKTLCYK